MAPRASPLEEKPCKSCTSFNDYLKATKEKLDKENDESDLMCDAIDLPKVPNRSDCPLDKDQLGNNTWGFLHTMAARYPEKPTNEDKEDMKRFFKLFAKFYPCEYCAADLREDLKADPPKVTNQEILSQWLCKLHNKINVKLGKPKFDCSKVNERWRDGWLDGSCDY